MGGNSSLAAVYTRSLARSITDQLIEVLRELGDDRFVSPAWPAEAADEDLDDSQLKLRLRKPSKNFWPATIAFSKAPAIRGRRNGGASDST